MTLVWKIKKWGTVERTPEGIEIKNFQFEPGESDYPMPDDYLKPAIIIPQLYQINSTAL